MTTLYDTDWVALAGQAVPILFLFGLATVLLTADLWWREHDRAPLTVVAVAGGCFAGWLAWVRWGGAAAAPAAAMVCFDGITWAGGIVICAAAVLTLLAAAAYLRERELPAGEFTALLLYGAVGLWIMIATTHLLMVFLGLEILSLAAYVLAGFHRGNRRSAEAALKYFLLGAVAAAFFLFGLAFLYGGAGTLDLQAIAPLFATASAPTDRLYLMIGVAFLLVGLGFKVAAVPFHFWTPDVYDGAPLPVTAFFATAVKAGAFLVLLRVAGSLAPVVGVPWTQAIWGLAVATMTVGNLAALIQEDVKRMLAYSSIAHAGYALMAIGIVGAPHLIFYLVAYTCMTIGAFAVVIALEGDRPLAGPLPAEQTALAAFAGLSTRRPWLAAAMAVFCLSLAGVPPTIGFFAKYYLFQAAVGAGQVWLVIVAVLNSVLSVGYYIRPIIAMYFRPAPEGAPTAFAIPPGVHLVVLLTLIGVLGLGLFPAPLLQALLQTGW